MSFPKSQYNLLRDQISAILAESQQDTRQDAAWRKAESYWHIGDALLVLK